MSDLQEPIETSPALDSIRARTPARILVGRAGSGYRTETLLDLRADHAAALDAVRVEMRLDRDFQESFAIFEVGTLARSKSEFLMRPDLGRRIREADLDTIATNCPPGADLQVVIGDGLSASAVSAQVPALLPMLEAGAIARGWRFGRPIAVRYCRVGVINDVGDRLGAAVVVLLIGERPGLATSESLSAYMAYRPKAGETDSSRNLVSNIHSRGLETEEAARLILELADAMHAREVSGVTLQGKTSIGVSTRQEDCGE